MWHAMARALSSTGHSAVGWWDGGVVSEPAAGPTRPPRSSAISVPIMKKFFFFVCLDAGSP